MKSINDLHGQGIAHPATSQKRILTADKRDIFVILLATTCQNLTPEKIKTACLPP